MDPVQIAILVVQGAVGLLLGLVTWTVRDMRGDQKQRLNTVEAKVGALELLVTGKYVLREDCRATHRDIDAKLQDIDRDCGRTEKDMARIRERMGLEERG
jgi:hypothetical protein